MHESGISLFQEIETKSKTRTILVYIGKPWEVELASGTAGSPVLQDLPSLALASAWKEAAPPVCLDQ